MYRGHVGACSVMLEADYELLIWHSSFWHSGISQWHNTCYNALMCLQCLLEAKLPSATMKSTITHGPRGAT
jgi:hypothetical protein